MSINWDINLCDDCKNREEDYHCKPHNGNVRFQHIVYCINHVSKK